jgi:hypothetical protein
MLVTKLPRHLLKGLHGTPLNVLVIVLRPFNF